jgi:hypothetical protein
MNITRVQNDIFPSGLRVHRADDNLSDNYERLKGYNSRNNSRNNKHIKRTDTFKIADKRAANKFSISKFSRVKNFYKMSNNRSYDRDIKYSHCFNCYN